MLKKLYFLFVIFVSTSNGNICTNKYFGNNKSARLITSHSLNVTKIYLPNNLNEEQTFNIFETWLTNSDILMWDLHNISDECRQGFMRLKTGLQNMEMWALKMSDASAKLPSGILSGNVNQYGQFDQCMELKEAQYCLPEIDFLSNWKSTLNPFKDLIHSYFPIRGTFKDPAHRVPSFSIIKWGLCLPKECTANDIETALKETLGANVYMRPKMCQKSVVTKYFTTGDYISRIIFSILILLITASTMCSYYGIEETKNSFLKFLMAFSLIKNWKSLTTVPENEIQAVDGIRGLAALGLLMSHKYMSLMYNPYINRTYMAKTMSMSWSVLGRTAILYTDAFMLISGLLSAKAMLRDLNKQKAIKIKDKLINRVFRISPNIIAVILFCTYILPNLGSGPLWPTVINHHSELCKKHMWLNIFYIHNHFGFENMCLTHSHQIGIDMQLFLTLPIFVYAIWKYKKAGIIFTLAAAVLSTLLRFVVTYKTKISHLVYFGIPISKMFDTANFSYILPTHRATIYLMGVGLAFILQNNYQFPKNKIQATVAWTVGLILGFGTLLGPFHSASTKYEYNAFEAALFGAFSPITCGLALSWIIYASNNGYGGWFGDLLSWKGFKLFSKISYGVYLTQFPVFFYNVGLTRYAGQYTSSLMLEIPETLAIILFSTLLTLCVEMPFMNICKMLTRSNTNNKQIETKCD